MGVLLSWQRTLGCGVFQECLFQVAVIWYYPVLRDRFLVISFDLLMLALIFFFDFRRCSFFLYSSDYVRRVLEGPRGSVKHGWSRGVVLVQPSFCHCFGNDGKHWILFYFHWYRVLYESAHFIWGLRECLFVPLGQGHHFFVIAILMEFIVVVFCSSLGAVSVELLLGLFIFQIQYFLHTSCTFLLQTSF